MNLLPPRVLSLGARALALAAAAPVVTAAAVVAVAGVATASTAPPTSEPAAPSEPAEMAPGCAEITALLDAADELGMAFFSEDGAAIVPLFESLPELGAAAAAAAPPEISETVALWVAPLADFEAITAGIDVTDVDALVEVFSSAPPTPESDEADPEVRAWAAEHCGWVSTFDESMGEAPEPLDCDLLDAPAAAAAAGVDIDVADTDGSGDFNLPGFWTKSCSYGNGAMALSTLSFLNLAQVNAFYLDNLVDDDGNQLGEVLDIELGTLPESTLVTAVDGSVTVSVFEAAVPFSVSFSGDVEPAAVVAAAEAVFAGLPEELPPPMASDSP
jgi:hypothetical protein